MAVALDRHVETGGAQKGPLRNAGLSTLSVKRNQGKR